MKMIKIIGIISIKVIIVAYTAIKKWFIIFVAVYIYYLLKVVYFQNSSAMFLNL